MPEHHKPDSTGRPQNPSRRGSWLQGLRYKPGQLALNTLSSTAWQVIRLACQVLSVVIMAKVLGPQGYGALVGFGGLAVVLGGFTGLGGGYLLLQSVSQDAASFSRHWHATLHIIGLSGLLFSLVFLLAVPALLQLPWAASPLLAIALSELVCLPLVHACSFAFQAHERLGWAGALPALMAGARLLGAIAFLLTGSSHVEHYVWFQLGASLLAALTACLMVQKLLQPVPTKALYSWAELRNGLRFSASSFTSNAQVELDKILSVRFLGAGAAGSYTIAYRLVTALAMPAVSLALAAQPRLFRHASHPGSPALRHLLQMMILAILGYALLAALVVFLIAPFLTTLLGTAFAPAVTAAQMLLPLLPLFGLRIMAGILLTSLGHPGQRVGLELLALALLAGLSTVLMPRHGLTGTVLAVLGSESLLLLMLSVAALRAMRKGELASGSRPPYKNIC